MKFKDRLTSLRKMNKLSREQLANKLGVSYSTISKYESGSREPDFDTLQEISNIFDVTTDYLLGKSDQPHLSEQEAFEAFINDPDLERWYKELPKSKEEDLRRLRKIWEAFKEDD
ncbi:helix-turn-helix domain-containing protein [Oceanobacillus kimchii]|uniref:helix-turn-helix domain-containing protein n=1 Tax=Oceanobacillus kimchii TaxID=746691 RepID=UPI003C7077F6